MQKDYTPGKITILLLRLKEIQLKTNTLQLQFRRTEYLQMTNSYLKTMLPITKQNCTVYNYEDDKFLEN
jgi:hypothetical protein